METGINERMSVLEASAAASAIEAEKLKALLAEALELINLARLKVPPEHYTRFLKAGSKIEVAIGVKS